MAGLACLARRAGQGNWCGYVAVPQSHAWHGRTSTSGLYCHQGGVNYAAPGDHEVCHADAPVVAWWFGFDCAHGGDLVPRVHQLLIEHGLARPADRYTYRTQGYVMMECETLALDLLDLNTGKPDHDQ